jgi:hypothetical protein
MVLMIASHLAILDRYLLSQTCQTMRRIVSCEWEQELCHESTAEKLHFLTRVAYSKPDRWVCAKCCKLHAVDIRDSPSALRAPHCLGLRSRSDRYYNSYHLEHHHIQLALKLSRLGVNRPYLESLLAPRARISRWVDTEYTHAAQPKVIEERFVLYETITITNLHGPISQCDLERALVVLCPHLALPRSFEPSLRAQDLYVSTLLDEATTAASEAPGIEIKGCCKWCPTDFSVFAAIWGQELTFRAWHDFGTYSSILSPYWCTQEWPGHRGRQDPIFDRTPGESRNLYVNSP